MAALSLPAQAGSYVLVLRLGRPRRLRLGSLGQRSLPAGWYLYVGSARGPGGLAARVGRHLRRPAAPYWHIDYLRCAAGVTAVWWRVSPERLECAWSRAISGWAEAAPAVAGFGASDCGCLTHLWRLPGPPASPDWVEAVGTVARG